VIELRLIRHALALGRHRNFARAAEALHLTQPTLSRSIAALEEALGVKLFDRDHKGVEPTAFGRVLLERGKALLGDAGALRREIELLAGIEVGTLTIGAGPYPGNVSVASAVARLVSRHPRLNVEVSALGPEAIVSGVLGGGVDLGVVTTIGLDDEPRIAFEPLPQHAVYLACRPGHPLAGRKRITLEDVLAYPLVAPPLRGKALVTVLKEKALGRIDPESGDFLPAITVNSLDLARLIATESDALFPGTASMIAPDIAAGRLTRLDFWIPAMTTTYGFVYLRNRTLSPAARAFMDALRAVEAGLNAGGSPAPRMAQVSAAPEKRRISATRRPPARPRA
jgi:DNA-binding transcriptional LysR family regulator